MEYMAQDRISFVASTKRDETPFFQSSYVVRIYDTRPFQDLSNATSSNNRFIKSAMPSSTTFP